jgi:serine/threonine protein kinase
VGEMIEQNCITPTDGLTLARHVISGLVHLHRNGVYHCDIKPRNLLWTDAGTRIIDFNVSVSAERLSHGGGSHRYLPPDLDRSGTASTAMLVDRDLYAFGITVYEAIAGQYPWNAAAPPPGERPRDPRDLPGLADLSPDLAKLLLKAIAPNRGDRFQSAEELAAA